MAGGHLASYDSRKFFAGTDGRSVSPDLFVLFASRCGVESFESGIRGRRAIGVAVPDRARSDAAAMVEPGSADRDDIGAKPLVAETEAAGAALASSDFLARIVRGGNCGGDFLLAQPANLRRPLARLKQRIGGCRDGV